MTKRVLESDAASTCLGDNLSDIGDDDDMSTPRAKAGRRSNGVQDGFAEGLEADQVRIAKKTVVAAMKANPLIAHKLAFLITTNKLTKKAKKGNGDYMLSPCQNKFRLIGKDRIIELLMAADENLDKKILEMMKLGDLQQLLDYAFAIDARSAVPSKLWSQLKKACMDRYESIGGGRLGRLTFERKDDNKSYYYEVDYGSGGVYELVTKKVGRKTQVVAITHGNGTTADVQPPLDGEFVLEDNDKDREAKLVSVGGLSDVPVARVFKKVDKLDEIPEAWYIERVGAPSTPPSVVKGKKPLMIEDVAKTVPAVKPVQKHGARAAKKTNVPAVVKPSGRTIPLGDKPSSSSSRSPKKPAKPVMPEGSGAPQQSAKGPPKPGPSAKNGKSSAESHTAEKE